MKNAKSHQKNTIIHYHIYIYSSTIIHYYPIKNTIKYLVPWKCRGFKHWIFHEKPGPAPDLRGQAGRLHGRNGGAAGLRVPCLGSSGHRYRKFIENSRYAYVYIYIYVIVYIYIGVGEIQWDLILISWWLELYPPGIEHRFIDMQNGPFSSMIYILYHLEYACFP